MKQCDWFEWNIWAMVRAGWWLVPACVAVRVWVRPPPAGDTTTLNLNQDQELRKHFFISFMPHKMYQKPRSENQVMKVKSKISRSTRNMYPNFGISRYLILVWSQTRVTLTLSTGCYSLGPELSCSMQITQALASHGRLVAHWDHTFIALN